jgi:hypothetical protein
MPGTWPATRADVRQLRCTLAGGQTNVHVRVSMFGVFTFIYSVKIGAQLPDGLAGEPLPSIARTGCRTTFPTLLLLPRNNMARHQRPRACKQSAGGVSGKRRDQHHATALKVMIVCRERLLRKVFPRMRRDRYGQRTSVAVSQLIQQSRALSRARMALAAASLCAEVRPTV